MRTLRFYILREHVWPFGVSLVVLTFILLIGNLVKLADLIINKGVPIQAIGRLLLYLMPYLATYTIPMAVLTAVLLTFGRLAQDNELTAMRASGVNFWSLLLPMAIVGCLASAGLYVVNDQVLPRAHFASRKLVRALGVENPLAVLEPGVFIKTFPPFIIFFYDRQDHHLSNVRVYEPHAGQPTRTIVAQGGQILPQTNKELLRLKLLNGTSDEVDSHHPDRIIKTSYRAYYLSFDLAKTREEILEKKLSEFTFDELAAEQRTLEAQGIDVTPIKITWHQRLATACTPLVFILIGLPMAMLARRGEKLIGFALSVGLCLSYYLLLLGGQALAVKGVVWPAVAMWSPNTLLLCLSGPLLYRVIER